MSDQYTPFEQVPPARPAASIAAILLLLLVFVVGLAVGQSGVLSPAATPTATPAADNTTPRPSQAPLPSGLPTQPPDAPADFGLFWQALEVVRQNFVGRAELDDRELTYGAIRGLVQALGDTGHSVFLTPEAVQAERDSLGGSIVGIGVLLGERDGRVVIVSVISDGPAQRAGIRSGDELVEVDGQSVEGLAPDEVVPSVRGEEGSTVVVTVQRPATGERLEFSIVREEIVFPAVDWAMVPGTQIALLRLIQFSDGAGAELATARDAAVGQGATSFILDLRSNPGGFVHEAVNVASLFLRDEVVYIRELANGEQIPVETNDALDTTVRPLVVLIDEGTASSAEIVSGALRSAERGELIGQTTFGTGTVLLDFDLADGSAIRLAVERWLTPDGELIFGRGIVPTMEVALEADQVALEPDEVREIAPADVPLIADSQLRAAIEHLEP